MHVIYEFKGFWSDKFQGEGWKRETGERCPPTPVLRCVVIEEERIKEKRERGTFQWAEDDAQITSTGHSQTVRAFEPYEQPGVLVCMTTEMLASPLFHPLCSPWYHKIPCILQHSGAN